MLYTCVYIDASLFICNCILYIHCLLYSYRQLARHVYIKAYLNVNAVVPTYLSPIPVGVGG